MFTYVSSTTDSNGGVTKTALCGTRSGCEAGRKRSVRFTGFLSHQFSISAECDKSALAGRGRRDADKRRVLIAFRGHGGAAATGQTEQSIASGVPEGRASIMRDLAGFKWIGWMPGARSTPAGPGCFLPAWWTRLSAINTSSRSRRQQLAHAIALLRSLG